MPVATVARWQHDDVLVNVSPSDAVRLVVNLRDRQATGDDAGRVAAPSSVRTGSVSLYPEFIPTKFFLEGQADILQVFLQKSFLEALVERAFVAPVVFNRHDNAFQAAALQVMVGAVRSDPDDGLLIEEALQTIAERSLDFGERLSAPPSHERSPIRGGLSFASRRRITALIDAALHGDGASSPTLYALAGAAGLSVSHFIRAYKDETGFTPHRHVLLRRLERAVELLGRSGLSVAEVGDCIGFATPAHFIATFRRTMGVTPGAVRHALTG